MCYIPWRYCKGYIRLHQMPWNKNFNELPNPTTIRQEAQAPQHANATVMLCDERTRPRKTRGKPLCARISIGTSRFYIWPGTSCVEHLVNTGHSQGIHTLSSAYKHNVTIHMVPLISNMSDASLHPSDIPQGRRSPPANSFLCSVLPFFLKPSYHYHQLHVIIIIAMFINCNLRCVTLSGTYRAKPTTNSNIGLAFKF